MKTNKNKGKNISDTLLEKCQLPIDISDKHIRPIDYPEMRNYFGDDRIIAAHYHPIVEDVNTFYRSVFGWIRANPSEKELAAAIKSVFIWSNNEDVDSNRTVNTKLGHKIFLDELCKKNTHTMILLGKRGAGKTFYLNYLLNTETMNLYKNYKLIWYRVDATKVFTNNIWLTSTGKHLSLKEYLYLQIAYVTLKYRCQATIWEDIFKNDNNEILTIIRSLCEKYPRLSEGFPSGDYTRLLTDYEDIITQLIQKPASELTKTLIQECFSDPKRLVTCELVCKTILTYLVKKGIRPLFIIDGIDNIDFYHHQDIYLDFIKELAQFCQSDDKPKHEYNALHVVVMRDETYDHLQEIQQLFWGEGIIPFRVTKLSLNNIIEKKREVAIQTQVEYFAKLKEELNVTNRVTKLKEEIDKDFPFGSQSDFDKQLDKFINEFLHDIGKVFFQITKETNIQVQSIDELITYLYNDNFRCFVLNFLNIYRYYLLFILKRTKFDVYTKPYLMTEGMILNGNLWLDSKKIIEPISSCIPNIFWFNPNEANGKWQGLCLYRLLQFINISSTSTRGEIISFLRDTMGYSESIINERFENAVAFGLLESLFSLREKRQKFSLSQKGMLFLEYPFLDINQFYYMALDTPLSVKVKGNNLAIRFHTYKRIYWEYFSEAAIITSITLIRHIISQVNLESSLVPQKYKDNMNLPNIFPSRLIKGMFTHITGLWPIRERYDNLLLDINGII